MLLCKNTSFVWGFLLVATTAPLAPAQRELVQPDPVVVTTSDDCAANPARCAPAVEAAPARPGRPSVALGSHGCCTVGGPGCNDPAIEECVCFVDDFCCDTEWDEQCVEEVETFGCASCAGGCGPDNPNNCFAPSVIGVGGCSNEICCLLVCELDAFCCDTSWDSLCAEAAAEVCAACGPENDNSCFAASPTGTIGCNNLDCCSLVCGADDFCCAIEWDNLCAESAAERCAGCGPDNTNNCFQDSPDNLPGCESLFCCSAVCAVDGFCCGTEWDALCAGQATQLCAGCGDDNPNNCYAETPTGAPGCNRPECCATVCQGDPFCCESSWDDLCADAAATACGSCGPGNPNNCLIPGSTPGCADTACCGAVCALDQFCCNVAWDGKCVGAAEAICIGTCPNVALSVVPPSGTVDARQPSPTTGAPLQGIGSADEPITITLADGAEASAGCFELCETSTGGLAPNFIESVTPLGGGAHRLVLGRPITPGAVTTIRYTGTGAAVTYFFHPANANADGLSAPTDILFLIDMLNGVVVPPHGIYSRDIDRSGAPNPADILRLIDLLNGADAFIVWNGTLLPSTSGCP